ncbi:unnamed protein product [Soboliphyme baturini]|uniref:Ribosomal protein L34 n=1 Tax=Soboliphyme baturini TaxID=241478 RepID=A0A183JBC2_9BILA|nr:unnamed protein product [Soboliphyme baturini]
MAIRHSTWPTLKMVSQKRGTVRRFRLIRK